MEICAAFNYMVWRRMVSSRWRYDRRRRRILYYEYATNHIN
jgi:hypothetical protein